MSCILVIPLGDIMTLYCSGISIHTILKEPNSVGENFGNISKAISNPRPWTSMKKELQERVYPAYRSFSTWSSEGERESRWSPE